MVEAYPIMIDLKDKIVIVVGGGQVAYRKIAGLIETGALITVISPVIHVKIEKLLTENQIFWKNKLFEPTDLNDALLVIAATDDREVNENVALSAQENQLVNVVDDKEISNFHVPAKLKRGKLTIAVATGGSSPILATVIRNELANIYGESYEDYLEFLAISREQVKLLHLNKDLELQILEKITEPAYRTSKSKQKEFLKMITSHI